MDGYGLRDERVRAMENAQAMRSSVGNAALPQPNPNGVQSILKAVAEAASAFMPHLDALEARLAPILMPTPLAGEGSGTAQVPPHCQLFSVLEEIQRSLAAAHERIERIGRRVEL